MQNDEVIWDLLKNKFCCYKVDTTTLQFCRNEYNVTGLCNRTSCPLSNSNYATVREQHGRAYLYVKTIERAHAPARLWERTQLSKSFAEAVAQIDAALEHNFASGVRLKCKKRLAKITEMLRRMRKLKLKKQVVELVPISKKIDRRERVREAKAEKAARLDKAITGELIERLKAGSYDDVILNARDGIWSRLLNPKKTAEVAEDAGEDMDIDDLEEGKSARSKKKKAALADACEADIEYVEDCEDEDEDEISDEDEEDEYEDEDEEEEEEEEEGEDEGDDDDDDDGLEYGSSDDEDPEDSDGGDDSDDDSKSGGAHPRKELVEASDIESDIEDFFEGMEFASGEDDDDVDQAALSLGSKKQKLSSGNPSTAKPRRSKAMGKASGVDLLPSSSGSARGSSAPSKQFGKGADKKSGASSAALGLLRDDAKSKSRQKLSLASKKKSDGGRPKPQQGQQRTRVGSRRVEIEYENENSSNLSRPMALSRR